ncbi:hypothetical protein FHR20_001003 [Sphingomonas leidyi]|uniref:2-oxoadipate dioxygenase/decarboxylase n=2 Tax=Sphingomonas leidyi TaxID=68569 RepID=A0A7X5UXL6_9SPHN|nr:hypothetical protein [Sphingomonas leidyi]
MNKHQSALDALVGAILPADRMRAARDIIEPMADSAKTASGVDALDFTVALNTILFADLLDRTATGAAYVDDVRRSGRRVRFDHGALRTIRLPHGDTGSLPAGEQAFRRILEPLGYAEAAIYPLPRLRMTGRAYRHRTHPETIPQFFVSELHVDRFDAEFAGAAARVFGTSRDPIDAETAAALARLGRGETLPPDVAAHALRVAVGAFGRQHDRPMLADYELLKRTSAEAAWIATEGNAFNHATDRVPDVAALAEAQRALGRPIKDSVEVSGSGRVRQTAFRADPVDRAFGMPVGPDRTLSVPGSFYEFITRDVDPATGTLDLSFDSGNATGIFGMTKAA